jgi:predicted double-glycine peptidase
MAEMSKWLGYGFFLFTLATGGAQAEEAPTPVIRHTLKEWRDQNIVKQQLDYSCGAAALATLLKYYYKEDVTEAELLARLQSLLVNLTEEEWSHKKRVGFSLLDLKKVALEKGYRSAGFELKLEQLRKLAAPVLVYVHPFDFHHFAVLRGIVGDRVYLADPSRGNLRMSLDRFGEEYGGVIFVLGKTDEDLLKAYPLAPGRQDDYMEPRLREYAQMGDHRTAVGIDASLRAGAMR